MDAALTSFKDYVVEDLLGHLEHVRARAMFGGYGLYLDRAFFAIITDDGELRFKVDDSNRAQYEALGSTPFVYTGHKKKKPVTMNYYLVPEEVLEDHERLTAWALQSAALSR
jgi:DNA transformation protein